MSSIFLSHTHRDKPFVRRLGERLQAHGIRIWLDEAEMQVGDSLIAKIEEGIRDVVYLGVVLSPDSVSSEWVRREVHIALAQEIHGRRVKVLPILHRPCDIPVFLIDKIFADFTIDFEEGLASLLARLTGELHEEQHRRRRTREMLIAAYQDWASFGKPGHLLLEAGKLDLVLQYTPELELSLDLLEYLLCSVAWATASARSGPQVPEEWLRRLARDDIAAVFERLLRHPTSAVRLGAISMVQRMRVAPAARVIASRLADEDDRKVRRAGARCLVALEQRLPDDVAHAIIDGDPDWLVRSLALVGRAGRRACLLIGDGSAFAAELGALAAAAGFAPVVTVEPRAAAELETLEVDIVSVYDLVILVRGEHYSRYGRETLYTRLRQIVSAGGALLATPWVGWETIHHKEIAAVLPFTQTHDGHEEDLVVRGVPTDNELSARLFSESFEVRASVERLRAREGSIVLLETPGGLPLFGYRQFGAGTCYYLNLCQHTCLGTMPSPVQSSAALHASLARALQWIARSCAARPR